MQKCFGNLYTKREFDQAYKLFQCFNLIIGKLTFSVDFRNKTSLFYFVNSIIPFLPRSYVYDIHATETVNTTLEYRSKITKYVFNFSRNVFATCEDNLLDCLWFFRCENILNKIIEIKKCCDFNFDCNDQSDERYCSKKTDFNCTTGFPVSIDKRKVNDNQIDCSDRSDECKDNPISSAEEMIKNPFLSNFL